MTRLEKTNPETCVNLANFLIAGLIKAVNIGGINFELLRRLTGLSIDEAASFCKDLGLGFPTGDTPEEIINNYGDWMEQNGLLEKLNIEKAENGLKLEIKNCWLSNATDIVRKENISAPLCMFLTTIAGRIENKTGKTIRIMEAARDSEKNICRHKIIFE